MSEHSKEIVRPVIVLPAPSIMMAAIKVCQPRNAEEQTALALVDRRLADIYANAPDSATGEGYSPETPLDLDALGLVLILMVKQMESEDVAAVRTFAEYVDAASAGSIRYRGLRAVGLSGTEFVDEATEILFG
ncbi:MAG TPA: hypothetical protein VF785_01030 [Gemmatimonadaceae bacterium]